ncbi:MAG: Mor transcription activator family, partial [Paenibacillus sp.]|nr:Mor transcription activator family [Paenibacillus sp.]
IYRLYENGSTVSELIQKYHLSEDSIRKIIVKTRGTAVRQR